MLFKTNTNGHRHPSICLFIIEQDTIGETKENNTWLSTQYRAPPKNSPINYDGVQLLQYWTTLPVYVYVSYPASRCSVDVFIISNFVLS